MSYLKSKNIEFETTDFSDFKNGSIEDDYIRSHDMNIHEIDKNGLYDVVDQVGTSAFTDRILFLMFNNTISEERRDKTLMDKLINEKTYIVEWALDGLCELIKNNLIFIESEEALAFKLRYINELNNVSEFAGISVTLI